MISNIFAGAASFIALMLAFLLGKSKQNAKHNEEQAQAAQGEAQEFADMPVTSYDTVKRLRERASNKD